MIRHPKPSNDTAYIGLFASVESATAAKFIDTICNKIPSGTKTLYVLFSTMGGSVSAGFVLYNFLRCSPYKIIMHNIGSVDSIGIVVFLAGEERYATDNATFLMHRVPHATTTSETAVTARTRKTSAEQVEESKIKSVLLQRTAITKADFKELFVQSTMEDARYAQRKKLIKAIKPCPFPTDNFYLVRGD